jgi:predicted transposase YbfD/YdcC
MQSTPLPPCFDTLSDEERSALLTDRSLRSLTDVFATLPDPRSRHGKRYDLPFLLSCLVAGLLCQCNSPDAVSQWCRDHVALLRRVFGPRSHLTPSGSLYRWLLPQLDVARLEWALAGWTATTRPREDHEPVALDGKTIRGAGSGKGDQPELVSVTTHQTHETLIQVRIPTGTNEIPVAQELLGWVSLHDRIVTADAHHAQTEFARRVLDGGGHYLLCLKANWPTLHAEIAAYFADPAAICISAETRERCRGRREQRVVRVTTELVPYLTAFPGVAQVGEITRTTQRMGQVQEQTTEYYLTDCPPPLLDAAAFLGLIRAHWSIESHHWIRDLVFGEDGSALRAGRAPQLMAAVRNAAETLIRRSGRDEITAARRHFAARPHKALTLVRRRFRARR